MLLIASTSMKNALLAIASALVFIPVISLAAGRQVTVITSLPFTISSPGIYVLDRDLTVNGSDAIDVNTPDVVIDLNGYSIIGSNGGFGVSAGQVANVIVENGRISGFATAVQLGPYSVARNLMGSDDEGISVQGNDCVVQNCILQGTGTGAANGAGIGIESTSRCEVTGCRVSGFFLGIASFGTSEDNAIVHNFVTNCKLGLSLSRTDCYQGNVATGCTKAFSTSGIEIGHENGHN
jgi:hypothetical protein